MIMWIDMFFKFLFKVIIFIACLYVAFSAVIISLDFCMKLVCWVIKESVSPFFKDLGNTIYDIKQLEWDIVYKETKRKIKKWWNDYSVEIITIGVGATITIALTIILYHLVMSLIK